MPRGACAYQSRAGVHIRKGEFDEAIADYTEAVRLDPGDANAYLGLRLRL